MWYGDGRAWLFMEVEILEVMMAEVEINCKVVIGGDKTMTLQRSKK